MSPTTRVREPDAVRRDHLSLLQVLPETTRLRHVQVCLLPLLQVQEGEGLLRKEILLCIYSQLKHLILSVFCKVTGNEP